MSQEKKENFSEKVLARLEKVKQIPAWRFKTKNFLFWALWLVFVVLGGSLSVAAIAFHTRFSGWNFYPVTHGSFGFFVFDTLPYVWLLIFVTMLFVGYENFKKTQHGYRYPFALVVGMSLLCCVVVGFVLYGFGVGKFLDEDFGVHLPFHYPAFEKQRAAWQNPGRGLLTGEVVSVDSELKTFILQDAEEIFWQVDGSKLQEEDWQAVVEIGTNDLRLLGLILSESENNFAACLVLPWDEEMRGHSFGRPPVPPCFEADCLFPQPFEQPILENPTLCEDLPGFKMILEMKNE